MIQDRFPMLEALHAEGPAPDRARHMMLYGQFVGSWDGRFVYHAPEGVLAKIEARFTASCLLELAKQRTIFVAFQGETIVGTASLGRNQVHAVFVNPDCHGVSGGD